MQGRQRDTGISNLLFDPIVLRYEEDPRFAAYCTKVGLPPPTASQPSQIAKSPSVGP